MPIAFRTPTLIPMKAFTTFGVNAKPNSENPIGYFGTGLKYAVAVTLRLGGKISLWLGNDEYVFFTRDLDFRGSEFTEIRMKRRRGLTTFMNTAMPYTTLLGRDWEPWMVVRELESNTRDEGGSSLQLDDENPSEMSWLNTFNGKRGESYIIIDCPVIEAAYEEMDSIFMPEDLELITLNDNVEVYNAESDYIFFRGMRIVKTNHRCMFTYNFLADVELTEDRTAKHYHEVKRRIRNALVSSEEPKIINSIVNLEPIKSEYDTNGYYEQYLDWESAASIWNNTSRGLTAALQHVSPRNSRVASLQSTLFPPVDDDPMVSIVCRKSDWLEVVAMADDVHAMPDGAQRVIDNIINRLQLSPKVSPDTETADEDILF